MGSESLCATSIPMRHSGYIATLSKQSYVETPWKLGETKAMCHMENKVKILSDFPASEY